MVNFTLYVNMLLIEQVDKFFRETFHPSTMSDIINVKKRIRVLLK